MEEISDGRWKWGWETLVQNDSQLFSYFKIAVTKHFKNLLAAFTVLLHLILRNLSNMYYYSFSQVKRVRSEKWNNSSKKNRMVTVGPEFERGLRTRSAPEPMSPKLSSTKCTVIRMQPGAYVWKSFLSGHTAVHELEGLQLSSCHVTASAERHLRMPEPLALNMVPAAISSWLQSLHDYRFSFCVKCPQILQFLGVLFFF